MKKLLTVLLLMVVLTTQAQDSAYNSLNRFNMTDSTDNDITFKRKCTVADFKMGEEVIMILFRVEFFAADGNRKMKVAGGYTKPLYIFKGYAFSSPNYVVSATGAYVGTKEQMLSAYGIVDTTINGTPIYRKVSGSQFYELTTPCTTEYDYLMQQFDTNNRLSVILKNIGQREAAAGRL